MTQQQQAFEPVPLDVLIIGAGLSGIGAAHALSEKCPDKRYLILERRQSIGGTWDLFRYPGIRSDSDMYTLSYSYKPWSNRKAIADGPDIKRYIEEIAEDSGAIHNIRFQRRVVSANWSSETSRWQVVAKATDASGAEHEEHYEARFLFSCSGYYSYDEGYRPTFPNEQNFKGQIIHPQFWPEDLDYAGKRVVVIGSGATAVTLIPAMAKTAGHVTMLQRSPSYVVARPQRDSIAQSLQKWLPLHVAHSLTRWKNVFLTQFFYKLARNRPDQFKQRVLHMVKTQVGDVDMKHFTPDYKPWDQRVCAVPDGDLFRDVRAGRASVVTDTIETFTENGIRLHSGQELEADIIVTATGLKVNALGDVVLTVDGAPMLFNERMSYKGMMLSDVPNMIVTFGYTNASWTLKAELTADYACRLLRYMDKHNYREAVVRRDTSVQEQPFLDFTSGYVQRAANVLPKQGDRAPWQVHQNYLKDKLTIQYGRIDDGVMQFQ
ncbi:FAD-containing monooxygenase EthA [Pseudomonas abyssi]|jgi:cyclohexanone monooxygenase|uniref:FAD-containing monooxygenase EthA n=1 Tax=Pseudomonas abyssi TaxID=170540 RepID=A0A2A3MFN3_9PSED|nr:NAD(P)/FAD-dependent oxidoreductase [Pseudomonas abyssi]MAD00313.1 NAD(P)/FAD-dependent oxidoreductase [Pseudomonadales bacterium]PBK03364.1 FAD-containing monooxygenase EthA [Pseudomonas abyssi]|tara:strand:- start:47362 stop:48834 length:1473 start_codon:yes stop_codon:yes gene_type:complete